MCPMQTVVTPRENDIPRYCSLNKNNINKEKPTIISGITIGIIMELLKNFLPGNFSFFVVAIVANNPKITAPVADIVAIFKLVIADCNNS